MAIGALVMETMETPQKNSWQSSYHFQCRIVFHVDIYNMVLTSTCQYPSLYTYLLQMMLVLFTRHTYNSCDNILRAASAFWLNRIIVDPYKDRYRKSLPQMLPCCRPETVYQTFLADIMLVISFGCEILA